MNSFIICFLLILSATLWFVSFSFLIASGAISIAYITIRSKHDHYHS